MKLKRIEISYFGNLKNVFLQPQDHLQMIVAGSLSTKIFFLFVKGVFYGLAEDEVATVTELRAGSLFSDMKWIGHGKIVFENDNKRYSIERYFGRRAHYDKYRITCDGEALRIPIRQPALTPGAFLFDIDVDEFTQTNLLAPGSDREEKKAVSASDKAAQSEGIRLMEDPETAQRAIAEQLDLLIGPDQAHGKVGDIRDEVDDIRNDLRRRYRYREQLETLTAQRDRMNAQINELNMRTDKLVGYRELHNRLMLIKRYERWHRLSDRLTDDMTARNDLEVEVDPAQEDDIKPSSKANKPYPGAKELSHLMYLRTTFGKAVSEYKVAYNQVTQKAEDFAATREEAQQAINRIVTERTRLERIDRQEQVAATKTHSHSGMTADLAQGVIAAAVAFEIAWFVLSFVVRAKVPALSYALLVLAVVWPFLCYLAYKRGKERERRKQRHQVNMMRRRHVDKLELQNRVRELDWELEHLRHKLDDIERQIDRYYQELEPKAERVETTYADLTYSLQEYGLQQDAKVREVDILLNDLRERAMSEKTWHQRLASLQTEADDIIGDLSAEEFKEEYDQAQAWIKENQAELGTFPPLTTFEIDRNLQTIREEKRVREKHLQAMSREIARLEEESLNTAEESTQDGLLPQLQAELESLERKADDLNQLRAWFNLRERLDRNTLPRLIADPGALDPETNPGDFLAELQKLAEDNGQQWLIFSSERSTIETARELALYLDQLT